MTQPQTCNNNDLNDRQNAVLERIESLEAKNRMLKEKIAWMEAAKFRHYLLIGLLFYMLVPVPLFSSTIRLCVIKRDPWFMNLSMLCSLAFGLVISRLVRASQTMCEPLRELLEMAKTQKALLCELRQEEEAIRRAHERRRRQEQMRQHVQQMVGRGLNVEDEDMAQCTICLEHVNLYGDVAILACQHIFHRSCIELWLPHKNTCPVCRFKIDSYYYWRIPNMDDD